MGSKPSWVTPVGVTGMEWLPPAAGKEHERMCMGKSLMGELARMNDCACLFYT